MEQKNFEVINIANAKFVYLENEKKLVSMQPAQTTYYFDEGKAEQTFILGGDESQTHRLAIDGEYYVSESAFTSGASIPRENAVRHDKLEDIMKNLFRAYLVKTDETGPFVWVYENGQATKWRIENYAEKVVIDHTNGKVDCGFELPDTYYDPEEVYKYNDYVVQEKDGKTKVREGVYRRLFLTDEQNALIDKLQTAIDECNKAGVAIDFDYADNTVTCFNRNGIKDYGWEPGHDEEKEKSYPLDLSRAGRCLTGIGDINTEDSSLEFVIDKPNED